MRREGLEPHEPEIVGEEAVELVVMRAPDRPEVARQPGGKIALDEVAGIAGEGAGIGVQPVGADGPLDDRQLGADPGEAQDVPTVADRERCGERGREVVMQDDVVLADQGGIVRAPTDLLPKRDMGGIAAEMAGGDRAAHVAAPGGAVGPLQQARLLGAAIDAFEYPVVDAETRELLRHPFAPVDGARERDHMDRQAGHARSLHFSCVFRVTARVRRRPTTLSKS